ncbi:Na+-transporting NADH:ubiquinone oxidoreductase subunit C [Nitrosomonas cryotolerans]|uniref:Na(+)-translocating NADH-quinone reductase subunit C n=1 Tax=Nitrosomonas cryotolerans ATCC 49181 TaxID=1131553 RepID=A0A1N6JK39_9PROT|nr:Na(+)-translocating NADH-quinone reductase subunit C [Nitrosomonas cryotolerans]SFQ03816.1 Na+-transporting NADH:ubiquinone oxidoreductase subunit C [Nitrosomonas cryotolerans]SIO44406.1 Na+-transporting NADH:ubiquinone oxidoreductase subunit C [Nitrosomonas cryotolerans ATCC 49181]
MAKSNSSSPNNSNSKTLLVALSVCLVCSLIVAGTTVLLKPIQTANQSAERKRIIVEIAELITPGISIDQAYQKLNIDMVELSSGKTIDINDAENFDIVKATKDIDLSTPIEREADLAQIRRKPKYLPVYQVNDASGGIKTLILPVYGYGLWSTLYGFLALEGDLRTVQGLKFYQHAETPGLGGEIDNPQWLALWKGKIILDENWQPYAKLIQGRTRTTATEAQYKANGLAGTTSAIRGETETDTAAARHKVDGLAGATLTTRGVENLLNFWLGKEGFGPYLNRLRKERS